MTTDEFVMFTIGFLFGFVCFFLLPIAVEFISRYVWRKK